MNYINKFEGKIWNLWRRHCWLPEYPDFDSLHTVHSDELPFGDHHGDSKHFPFRTVLSKKKLHDEINYEEGIANATLNRKHSLGSNGNSTVNRGQKDWGECEDLEFGACICKCHQQLTKIHSNWEVDLDILKTNGFNILSQELKLYVRKRRKGIRKVVVYTLQTLAKAVVVVLSLPFKIAVSGQSMEKTYTIKRVSLFLKTSLI